MSSCLRFCLFLLLSAVQTEIVSEKGLLCVGKRANRGIIIDVADRELNIGLSSDGQISVNYFDSEKQYLEISVSESNELVIRLAYDRSLDRILSESSRTGNIAE